MTAATLLLFALQGAVPTTAPLGPGPVALDCSLAQAQTPQNLVPLACLGDEQIRRAESAPKNSSERRRALEEAVDSYRKAASAASTHALTAAAFETLARLYDKPYLDDPARLRGVLRDLAGLEPEDPAVLFRLAKVEEDQQLVDDAESTLHRARQLQPNLPEANKKLAQFYARRVAAMSAASKERESQIGGVAPGQRDQDGFYRMGGNVEGPKKRENGPAYPEEARAAGVSGAVGVEISIDETGIVRDARVQQSIPLLDAAALETVKRWRYQPTLLNGKPVPVKMIVTVNFTLPRP